MKSLEIFSSYKCNYACSFCFENELFRKDLYPQFEIENRIKAWKTEWYTHIVFSWWEPTLDIHLVDNVRLAKTLWYEHILIHTNGFKTSNISFFRSLCDAWMTWMVLSIHGYKHVSDYITKNKKSFFYIHNTLLNFIQIKKEYPQFILDTNTVICRANKDSLHTLISYLHHFPICRPMLSFTVFEWKKVLQDVVTYEEFLEVFPKLADLAVTYKMIDFCIQWIPRCVIPEKYWMFIDANKSIDKSKLYHSSSDFQKDEYTAGFQKLDTCQKCQFKDNCKWFLPDSLGNLAITAL